MSKNQTLQLNDGHSIPQLGFGVWQVESDVAEDVVAKALQVGFRHIDTAKIYGNEEGVGRAIAKSGIPREELFVTTKLWNDDQGHDSALQAIDASLERLGLDYVDLYLIHWSQPEKGKYLETWKAFQEIKESGKARSIGVSNFTEKALQDVVDTGVVPAVHQIELHPSFNQQRMREIDARNGILTEAWSPLGQGKEELQDETIGRIAEAHGATPAQVIIAWHLAIGNVVFPKSVTPERIQQNWDAQELTLTAEEIEQINGLTREDGRLGPDPADFND
ncbi:aldo/keto reductase [Glutamicibacter protophormiae]|uniref:Putative oxidoreductase n=1 Tax=Kocuria varians TaxID=1272 RepID=A0A7D7KXZ5_KOCVA|nr:MULTISPECIES: aldo/keto reductase [Kocuria]WNB88485.1 aldo/keto reductase [Glutamicibacter protophormiae]MDN5631255.1 aldo/keto reductase [Kocuria sp.]QMS55965.1 putative oxidoreductase [Kocuria varians]RUP85294.1 aldo/keto reductase [Kocuria sp. HSID17590]RUQ07657.1 aldo/keto reductase [Kocuria sp. HSID17582]